MVSDGESTDGWGGEEGVLEEETVNAVGRKNSHRGGEEG